MEGRGGSRDLYRGVPVEPKLNSQNIMESDVRLALVITTIRVHAFKTHYGHNNYYIFPSSTTPQLRSPAGLDTLP